MRKSRVVEQNRCYHLVSRLAHRAFFLSKARVRRRSLFRVSTRLADSPCCLVQQEHALSPSMVRMMRSMRQDVPEDALSDAMTLLYDTALVAEGSPVPDGAKFAKLLAGLMMK